jgi:hypothetical protein
MQRAVLLLAGRFASCHQRKKKMAPFLHCPHPQPFSLGRREPDLKVPLPSGEGFRVRANSHQDRLNHSLHQRRLLLHDAIRKDEFRP